MEVELGPGVADLLWRMGEKALTVELTRREALTRGRQYESLRI
jgi:hypothetical protein